ncbi:MAG: DAK2 domain-containing protein [Lachnospiraceae bacterium]|nr:DAK2 domain-containing protein [Lachnospiraceae bacterium]MDE6626460.1 DAK2 domain-containing protein [Lachnospiraceae bacterium]
MKQTINVNASHLQYGFLAGAKRIEEKKEYINELNVFPVPDGDTGTNMTLTITSAAREVANIKEPTFANVTKAMSTGSLRGARGNSGVILSQLIRGFCKELEGREEVTIEDIAAGFNRAVATAYKAVMKPKEGTILTVAKGLADKASELSTTKKSILEFATEVLEYGREVLNRTPEMLPVLKEAGVVDSGGEGLMTILEGAYDALTGKTSYDFSNGYDSSVSEGKPAPDSSGLNTVNSVGIDRKEIDTSHIKYGYCTEFIIMLEKEYNKDIENTFKSYLESIGDSLVVVSDDEIVKVHVHTNHPGLAFERGLTYGSLTSMKIDNMREEHREKVIMEAEKMAAQQAREREELKQADKGDSDPAKRKQYGFISVSVGQGMNDIFKDLGVDYLIEGGQTMNPSTEDMLNAIEQVNADTIYILPNNKNIILAANQAQSLTEDKEIIVVPSRTAPQGVAALISFDAAKSGEENLSAMTEEMANVKTGQVTYAVRDTNIDGKTINAGDIMGIDDDGIKSVSADLMTAAKDLMKEMVDEDSELISIYYGADIKEEDAKEFADYVEETYGDCDVEFNYGGQPIYYYILSVE